MNWSRRTVLRLLTVPLVLECGGDPTSPNDVSTVDVQPSGITLLTADSSLFTAVARNSAGDPIAGKQFVWSSSDTSIATVSASGLVKAKASGTATIAATTDAKSDSAITTVVQRIARVVIGAVGDTIFTGDSTAWFSSTLDSTGQTVFGRSVTWHVEDTTVIRGRPIGNDIWLKARAPGVSWVIAMSEGRRDSAQIWVRNHVGTVDITPDSATILIASTLQLTSILRDTAGAILTGRPVQWEVLRGPATIDSTGLVHALAGGAATIVARSEGMSDTARLYFRIAGAFTSVTAGDLHTCGRTSAGAVYCWGYHGFGQLGIGSSPNVRTFGPALVGGGATYTSVSTGFLHTCAIATSLECWGSDWFGALGNSSGTGSCQYGYVCRGTPLAVTGAVDFTQVSGGDRFTCALDGAGAAYCWGNNSFGQLGIGTADVNSHPAPEAVGGGISFQSLTSGGGQVCALSAGVAYCWGWNHYGQLGLGIVDTSGQVHAAPDTVAGGHRFRTLSAGWYHTCGVAADSSAFCWGLNESGQLGTGGTSSPVTTPVAVTSALKFFALAAGSDHTCGIAADSLAYCWGSNSGGGLGDGTGVPHYTPMPVSGGLKFATITANRDFTCGVTTAHVAYCWGGSGAGGDGEGRLGTDPLSNVTVPGRVQGQP